MALGVAKLWGGRAAAVAVMAAAGMMWTAAALAEVAPITIVINQSPWFDGFRNIVQEYEKQTGNKVELDVNPFEGSLEKQRNSVRSAEGQYDILIMNSGWYAEMYYGGFIEPITDIDPSFKLDPGIYHYDDTIYFNPETKEQKESTGKLMSMPVNPNIPLLYYRADLYEKEGLKVPETFDDLYQNAVKLTNRPRIYGIVQRGARGAHSVAYDFYPYLYGFGGSIFKDQKSNDFTVTINSDKGKQALDFYIKLAKDAGHPNTASLDQGQVIQNMVTGKAAHMITVIAAWAQMDDPNKSAVVGKVDLAVPPHAPGYKPAPALGHWLAGISKNVPKARQQAAVEFFKWFQKPESQIDYAKVGGVPVSKAAYESDLAKDPKFRWMKAMEEASPLAVNIYTFPEAAEVIAILEVELNRAIAGEEPSNAALNSMAEQIYGVMSKHGYNTGKLDPLP